MKDPFRVWFSHIGEVRSLCPGIPLMALTATASTGKRRELMKKLCMNPSKTKEIVDTPDRPNIKLSVTLVKSTHILSETFGWLLENVNEKMDRHVVFCYRIEDCSALYDLFIRKGKKKHVQMYHSRTPARIQDKIRKDMDDPKGSVRVLFCTNAAGMGVNFSGVNNVVNYGPPADLDTLLQQLGRAGRDGAQSHHLMVYHKRQLVKRCDVNVLHYLKDNDQCRRMKVLEGYGSDHDTSVEKKYCCDVCERDVDEVDVFTHHFLMWAQSSDDEGEDSGDDMVLYRRGTDGQKAQLHQLLLDYRQSLLSGSMIVSEDLIHGFSLPLVSEIVDKCDYINSASDVMTSCNVMSYKQAQDVVDLFELVFPGSVFPVDSDSSDAGDW
jgi:ATP-dependent DNA helicase RecQ